MNQKQRIKIKSRVNAKLALDQPRTWVRGWLWTSPFADWINKEGNFPFNFPPNSVCVQASFEQLAPRWRHHEQGLFYRYVYGLFGGSEQHNGQRSNEGKVTKKRFAQSSTFADHVGAQTQDKISVTVSSKKDVNETRLMKHKNSHLLCRSCNKEIFQPQLGFARTFC